MQPWMRKIDFTHFFPQGLIPQLETLTTPVGGCRFLLLNLRFVSNVLTRSEDQDKRLIFYELKVILFN